MFGNIGSIGAIWFLPAMFWCKTVYNIICSKCPYIILRIIIIAVLSLIAIYLFYNVINLPLGILTGCSALMFYGVGHWAKRFDIDRTSPLIILGLFVSWVCAIEFSEMSMSECRYDHLPLDFIGACGGTLFIYRLSKLIDKRWYIIAQALSWCGKYSMVVLCFHFVNAIIDLEKRLGTSNWVLQFAAQMIIIVPTVFVCCRIKITRKLFGI